MGIVHPLDIKEILKEAALYNIKESSTLLLQSKNKLHVIAVKKQEDKLVNKYLFNILCAIAR